MIFMLILFLFSGCGVQTKPIFIHTPEAEVTSTHKPTEEDYHPAYNANFDNRVQHIQEQVDWIKKRIGP